MPRARPVLTASEVEGDTSEPLIDATVGQMLREAAAEAPDRVALIAGVPDRARRRRWTYAELLVDSERCARALLGRFAPGERVAVWAPNVPEWVILEFGAALAGLVLVTVNPAFREEELAYVLAQSQAAGIVLVTEFRRPMRATLEAVRTRLPGLREVILLSEWESFLGEGDRPRPLASPVPSDIVQVQYTSGTTGFPKGALLTHHGITNTARLYARRVGLEAGEVLLNPMPLFHTGGCVLAVLGAVAARATQVLVFAFEAGLVLELLETEGCTLMGGVPTMLVALMEHPDLQTRRIGRLRGVVSGGATVPAALVRRIEAELGVGFCIVYGCTECSPLITQTVLDDDELDKAETLGRPVSHVAVRIVHPVSGEVVPVGTVGEICARGYNVMAGYNDMPEQTSAAIDAAGWYHTGDLGSMDERGYCRIEGRLKDMIIRGGENISPREVEDLLATHPAVAEVAVVGLPDPRWGEVVAAFVRAVPGQRIDTDELAALCRTRLAAYKCPVRWVVVAEMPVTASGKVQKFLLRERAGGG